MISEVKTQLTLHLKRLAALFYDLMVLLGLLIVSGFIYLGALHLWSGSDVVEPGNWLFRAYLCLIIFGYVYISWRRGGQTIGMKAWRLRAVSCNGQRLTASQILFRFIIGIFSFAFLGLGYWWSLWDAEGRTLAERWSDSRTDIVAKINNP